MGTLGLLLGLFFATTAITAHFVMLMARALKATRATIARSLLTVIAITVGSLALGALIPAAPDPLRQPAQALLVGLLLVLLSLLAMSLIFGWTLGLTRGRSWLLTIAYFVFNCGFGLAMVWVLRGYVLESFVVPTNSMAPTITGWHQDGKCPHCGGRLVIPAPDPMQPFPPMAGEELTICADCKRMSKILVEEGEKGAVPRALSPDRIIANKLLTPRRWDLVVFRFPRNPAIKYVDRLVGLPGETVFVKEGTIWADGKRLELPAELAGLRYDSELDIVGGQFGPEDRPWKLGPNEYVVLGDFTQRASDSRDWGTVPGENIEGVVTLTYWPPARWRIFR
jgi:signal peptidase I